jgi:flagellar protein FliS
MSYGTQAKAKSYKALSVQTASPGKIVLMLFDGILRFMGAARDAFGREDLTTTRRYEQISNNIIRAQRIVSELQANLDMEVPGELPKTLYGLYDYFFAQLNEANMKKQVGPLDTIEPMVKELRDSWEEMLTRHEAGAQESDPPPAPQTLQDGGTSRGFLSRSA